MATRSNRLPFDLHALEAFLGVCDARSMALAAKKLSLTQPAVSQAIADLETRMGVKLFDRSVRPLALTPAGEIMRQRASALVSEARQLATVISHTARGRLALIRAGL
ncbi:MAG: LysR family transcriptional regulator, partial [Hyphomicrobium sp.]